MAEQEVTPTQEEIEFQERHGKAWEEVRAFLQTVSSEEDLYSPRNPQHRLAPEFFQISLERRPSEVATRALDTAFTMWSNLRGVSDHIRMILPQIAYEEDVWDKVSNGIISAFSREDRREEGLSLIEELIQKVVPLKSRSVLLFELARSWMHGGEHRDKARQAFEQVLAWDVSAWHVDFARGYIYEVEHLNVSQPAPLFRLKDIDGNWVDLAEYRGRVTILHFWSTTCGPCARFYPHLRKIVEDHQDQAFGLIGFSEDYDLEAARKKVQEEQLTWPQICEGNGWKDTAFKLFNITGIPSAYVIDPSGRIALKVVGSDRIEELEATVCSLLSGKRNVS
jgi:peroxiredoxin